jgi:hypothetical protein
MLRAAVGGLRFAWMEDHETAGLTLARGQSVLICTPLASPSKILSS